MQIQAQTKSEKSGCRIVGIALIIFMMAGTSACATDYSDQEMQPLAATAFDLARSVRRFAATNPEDAKSLNDKDLVRKATAHDPSLMKPYDEKGLLVRGLPQGVVLICSGDGKQGLIEDAACSVQVDSTRWNDPQSRCEFIVDLATACAAK